MRKTITKHRPSSLPRGDYVALCSFCGFAFWRSELTVDEAGSFVCPDEGEGLDQVALAREQIAAQDHWLRDADHDAPRDPPVTGTAPNMDTYLGTAPGSRA